MKKKKRTIKKTKLKNSKFRMNRKIRKKKRNNPYNKKCRMTK